MMNGLDLDSFTIDNRMAGALAAEHLHALGHRKFAVIMGSPEMAIDDLPWFDVIRPRVSVVVQPSEAMVNRCMEILLERVRHANGRALPAEQIVLEPALLVRDSTARPISL